MAFCMFSSFLMCNFPIHSKWKSFSYEGSSFYRLTIISASESDVTNKTSIGDDESYMKQARKLKEEVRMMLGNMVDPLEKLKLIDTIQRLGLSYHFEAEINKTLKNIRTDRISIGAWKKDNLYATTLEFRFLRQHGVNQDFKGLLNLELVTKLLKQCLKENNDHQYLWILIDHALELPLHWRMPRLEARWFIEAYEKNKDKNPIILELAILDYNIVQSIHQEDLRYWWKELGIGKRFSFTRDRVMENFLWGVGMIIVNLLIIFF
ncbi:hypothetical protein GOBAR_DD20586 [Gossypium barbadense]|nr:hypothetical protein GOBAR_DD20586 [Gossypium barbadense]